MKLVTWLKSLIVKPVNKVPTKTQFKLAVKKPCPCCEPKVYRGNVTSPNV